MRTQKTSSMPAPTIVAPFSLAMASRRFVVAEDVVHGNVASARRHDVDAAGQALLGHGRDVVNQTEEREDGDVGRAGVEHGVRVVRYLDAELDGQARKVAGVHPDDLRVGVDGAYELRTVLVQVADGVLCHLPATVLDDPDWPATHGEPPLTFRRPGAGGYLRVSA